VPSSPMHLALSVTATGSSGLAIPSEDIPAMRVAIATVDESKLPPRDDTRFGYYVNEGVYGSFKDRVLLQERFTPHVLWCKRLTDALPSHQPRKESVVHMKSFLPLPVPGGGKPAADQANGAEEEEFEMALRNMPHFKSRIFGPTTHPLDVICSSVMLPELDVGDWLYFTRMGAYTISLASCYNGYEKPNTLYIWTDQEEEESKTADATGKLKEAPKKKQLKKIRRGMRRRMVRIRKKKVTRKKGKPTKKKRNRNPN